MYYSAIFLALITILLVSTTNESSSCTTEFQGFGVHLGSIDHLNETNEETVQNVLDSLYHDLQIRHFRTSYEPYFSPSAGVYDFICNDTRCTWAWESILKILSNTTRYPEYTLFASVWSPPFYMKEPMLAKLKHEYELPYYHFLKNITYLIQQKYNLTVERISPVNEPDNFLAPWHHCNMGPFQLCRMVAAFNDPLISICPENSYFWITEIYMSYGDVVANCLKSCAIIGTHAYRLRLNIGSENFGLVTYDLKPYKSPFGNKPIWMTEVSSTFFSPDEYQIEEGISLALNIINFLATTCVQRYYYWIAYTNGPSGESLIWGENGQLYFPKKYFVYKHFTNASAISSAKGPVRITHCKSSNLTNYISSAHCLHFDNTTKVFVHIGTNVIELPETADCSCSLCCTTDDQDFSCNYNTREVPPTSVCTCISGCGLTLRKATI